MKKSFRQKDHLKKNIYIYTKKYIKCLDVKFGFDIRVPTAIMSCY